MLRPGVDPALNDGTRLLPVDAVISGTRETKFSQRSKPSHLKAVLWLPVTDVVV